MKNFVVIVILALYFTATTESLQEIMNTFQKARLEVRAPCLHLLSNETLTTLKTRRHLDNPEIRCFKACLMERQGYLKDNKIFIDEYEKLIDVNLKRIKELNMKFARACVNEAEKSENKCELAHNYNRCILHQTRKHYNQTAEENDENQNQHL
uniref:Odorant-binding protein 5 n=1 Tax=Microplitis mediator TaxID=375433 RepID=A1YWY6_9HYME|nr:odorant-binding protein 5 [Microplitis mediator]